MATIDNTDKQLEEARIELGMDLTKVVAESEPLSELRFTFGGPVEFRRFYHEVTWPPSDPAWKRMRSTQLIDLAEKAEQYLMSHEAQVLFNCAVEREEHEQRTVLALATSRGGRSFATRSRTRKEV